LFINIIAQQNIINSRNIISIAVAVLLHIFILLLLQKNINSSFIASNIGSNLSISLANISSYSKIAQTNNNKNNNKIKKTILASSKNGNNSSNVIDNENIAYSKNFSTIGNKEMPIYPKRSLKLGQEGVVYLKILISESGVSEQIEFLKKSQYPLLNKSAINAVKKWQFKPVIIGGKAVKSWVEVPIEFKIS
jgi:TonB family protein